MIKRYEVDLSVEHTDFEIDFEGSYRNLMIVRKDIDFQYKLDDPNGTVLYSSEVEGFQDQFVLEKIYITNSIGSAGQIAVILVF